MDNFSTSVRLQRLRMAESFRETMSHLPTWTQKAKDMAFQHPFAFFYFLALTAAGLAPTTVFLGLAFGSVLGGFVIFLCIESTLLFMGLLFLGFIMFWAALFALGIAVFAYFGWKAALLLHTAYSASIRTDNVNITPENTAHILSESVSSFEFVEAENTPSPRKVHFQPTFEKQNTAAPAAL
eukprot:Colp12_sorted_trinity150504_noHs@427